MVAELVLAAVASWIFTLLMRRLALSRHIMDVPNARSSHTQPVPRGGGVAFVLAFLVFGAWMSVDNRDVAEVFPAVSGVAAWIALIGFLDDRGHIKARWRLLAHGLGAAWVLGTMPLVPSLAVFGLTWSSSWLTVPIWGVFMVWMLNLYNFMDGIDGLAASQAIFVTAGGAGLYLVHGDVAYFWFPLLLAVSVGGFLVWNFPPAKIFMGDAGSGFLGIVLAFFTMQAAVVDMQLFWGWMILSGVFIVDATFTLLRRLLEGRKVYEAHRTHAYQNASRRLGSHRSVTLCVWVINVVWLLPFAWWVSTGGLQGELGMVLAYAPLLFLAVRLGAGKPEQA